MNVKVCVAYKKEIDYNATTVRSGPEGGTAPEFKCFNCGKWFDGNTWKYTFSKHWYPFLQYNVNFLCGPSCSMEASEKHKDEMVKI